MIPVFLMPNVDQKLDRRLYNNYELSRPDHTV